MTDTSPYEPPKSVLVDSDITRRGRYVIFNPEVEWPSRCFKCNVDTAEKKEIKLSYINPWFYLSILINLLLTIILVLIFRKRFAIELPICELHLAKRRKFLLAQWSLLVLLVLNIVAIFLLERQELVFVAIVIFIAIVITAIFGRQAHAAKFKQGNLWVRGAGKEFLDSLPDYSA